MAHPRIVKFIVEYNTSHTSTTEEVSKGTNQAYLLDLLPYTNYTIRVAASSTLLGNYSPPKLCTTDESGEKSYMAVPGSLDISDTDNFPPPCSSHGFSTQRTGSFRIPGALRSNHHLVTIAPERKPWSHPGLFGLCHRPTSNKYFRNYCGS